LTLADSSAVISVNSDVSLVSDMIDSFLFDKIEQNLEIVEEL
jgi:hypothetical protein